MTLAQSSVLRFLPTAAVLFLGLMAFGPWSLIATIPLVSGWQAIFIWWSA